MIVLEQYSQNATEAANFVDCGDVEFDETMSFLVLLWVLLWACKRCASVRFSCNILMNFHNDILGPCFNLDEGLLLYFEDKL
jgi:hypothetical protein